MYKGLKIIQNSTEEAVIDIEGRIGKSSWWDDEEKNTENSNERIKKDLNAIKAIGASHVIVNIHSLGGDVDHAFAIHDALVDHPATITTDIKGFCASSGTIIAMAGDIRKMSNNALHLSHKCSSYAWGNENELQAELDSQRVINERIVNIYMKANKVSKEKIEALMNENNGNGKWITAKEAEEYGFVTEVYTPGENKKVAAISQQIFSASKLPALPSGYESLLENEKEIIDTRWNKIENFISEKFQIFENKFNNKINTPMKDKFPLIVALLALGVDASYDAKKGINLTNEQLEKIEAEIGKISGLEKEKSTLENKVTEKENKVNELQAIVDNIPSNTTPVNGADPKDDDKKSFEEKMAEKGYYQDAANELGQTFEKPKKQ